MRFIEERLDQDGVINHLIEFGFEDVGAVYADENVMYVKGVPVILSSVYVALEVDEYRPESA